MDRLWKKWCVVHGSFWWRRKILHSSSMAIIRWKSLTDRPLPCNVLLNSAKSGNKNRRKYFENRPVFILASVNYSACFFVGWCSTSRRHINKQRHRIDKIKTNDRPGILCACYFGVCLYVKERLDLSGMGTAVRAWDSVLAKLHENAGGAYDYFRSCQSSDNLFSYHRTMDNFQNDRSVNR